MKNKKSGNWSFIFTMIVLLLGGCTPEDGIFNVQIGENSDSGIVAGQTYPIVAEISVSPAIKYIDVEVRPISRSGWAFNKRYEQGVKGKNKVTFKTEVPIPLAADANSYELIIHVTSIENSILTETINFNISKDNRVPIRSEADLIPPGMR
jgi:hypothetical protein